MDLGAEALARTTLDYVMVYETTESPAYIFNTLRNDYFKNGDSLMCVGTVAPNLVLVIVRKITLRQTPLARITTPTGIVLEPRYFKIKRGCLVEGIYK